MYTHSTTLGDCHAKKGLKENQWHTCVTWCQGVLHQSCMKLLFFSPSVGRKEIILRSISPWGFCPFHHPDSPKGQVVRVSGELLPCSPSVYTSRMLLEARGKRFPHEELSSTASIFGRCLAMGDPEQRGGQRGIGCRDCSRLGHAGAKLGRTSQNWRLEAVKQCRQAIHLFSFLVCVLPRQSWIGGALIPSSLSTTADAIV